MQPEREAIRVRLSDEEIRTYAEIRAPFLAKPRDLRDLGRSGADDAASGGIPDYDAPCGTGGVRNGARCPSSSFSRRAHKKWEKTFSSLIEET